jgi:Tol biopolymer transport system component
MNDGADQERSRSAIVDGLDFGVRPVVGPLLPVRAIVAALLVVAVLVAAPGLLDRRTGTTPRFGPAQNGLIVWAIDGDIITGDPDTETTHPLIAGPGVDRNPAYSPDGSRLVFLRQVPTDPSRFDLFVSGADGSAAVMVSAVPLPMPEAVEWAPDGGSLLVNDTDGQLRRYSIHGSPPRLLVDGVHLEAGGSRPPDGADLLYERKAQPGALYVMARDGSRARELVGPTSHSCSCTLAGPARWSPDGQSIALAIHLEGAGTRIVVMGADGTGLRPLTDETGSWIEEDPTWSPLGDRIAFNRWQRDDTGDWQVRPIGIVAATGGHVESVGVAPAADGALIEWSPDGRSILSLPKTLIDAYASYPDATGSVARPVIINVDDGSARPIDWSVGSIASWQRQAP